MSLRSVLSNLRYSRSRQERPEEAGLIISKRLKDLVASTDGQLKPTANGIDGLGGSAKDSVEIEVNHPNPPAVKTAA